MTTIRPETPDDAPAIAALITDAFLPPPTPTAPRPPSSTACAPPAPSSSPSSPPTARPSSATSPPPRSRIAGRPGWAGIGPLAVRADRRRAGIGAALMTAALAALRARGLAGAVLVGDPAFYARFGFAPSPGLTVPGIPDAYVLALPFAGPPPTGAIAYHPAFFPPDRAVNPSIPSLFLSICAVHGLCITCASNKPPLTPEIARLAARPADPACARPEPRPNSPHDRAPRRDRAKPRPRHRPRHLRRLPRLRRRLQGVEHHLLAGSPPRRPRPLRRPPRGHLPQPRPHLRGRPRDRPRPRRPLPEVLPALRRRPLRHRLPDRRQLQARHRRHRPRQRGRLHRLRPLRLGLPLRRPRDGPGRRRHEEMHALLRPH